MKILDGKLVASKIKKRLKQKVGKIKKAGKVPGLAVVLVGNDPASKLYVGSKKKTCQELGIASFSFELNEKTSEKKLLKLIEKLNNDRKVHGILVQLPLPKHINEKKIIEAISPQKDVDCFHPHNVGRLSMDYPILLSCTPAGIMELLKYYQIRIEGQDAVIINKSNIVGKPLAMMLMNLGATVTVCHSKTKKLSEKTKRADVLITAVGKEKFISNKMVKRGAVIVDVGINRSKDGKVVGDVDFKGILKIAGAVTPVPGGIGPMTIVMLMENVISACEKR
jgi:methylenetetrahydrofolate dehydrogenase (NADP+) / methenyltetrahydrofolate cyclohydrolase